MTDESVSNGSDENQNENDVSLWREDPTRPAGFRRSLIFGGEEYGFRWIPAGEFDMGSPTSEKGRFDDEVLHHVVLTRGFWALETPVTVKLFLDATSLRLNRVKGAFPIGWARYDDALAFCEEFSKAAPRGTRATLPTEAQWECACRAGTKTAYCWGDEWDRRKAKGGWASFRTRPVKTYAPNAWGLYDVHGNVEEWVLDWYGDYPTGTVVDPTGAESGERRVCRGGSWRDLAMCCRSAYRGKLAQDDEIGAGFRIVLRREQREREEEEKPPRV